MRIGDLVCPANIPTVVQLSTLSSLRQLEKQSTGQPIQNLEEAWSPWLEQYYLIDPSTRTTFNSILESLVARDHGRGFLVNGVYGSGKSHLLMVLALLCEYPRAWNSFLNSHPEYSPSFEKLHSGLPWLVVDISLDEYSGKQYDLEQVMWEETQRALDRAFVKDTFWHAHEKTSRAETFSRLLEHLANPPRAGVIWLLDELSMFLSSKSHRDLQNDASFLQFLGQRTHQGPVWIVGTLQKTVEDLGEIEPYTVSQIKDRFNTRLSLALTGLRTLIDQKLILRVAEPASFRQQLAGLLHQYQEGVPHPSFGIDDLTMTYPLHPTTVDCLESVVARFFSRTRSAIGFIQDQVAENLDRDMGQLVTAETLLDYFLPDLLEHPELRLYATEVLPYFQNNIKSWFPEDSALALRLVKLLIVLKIANRERSVQELEEDLFSLEPEGRETAFERIPALLERLHREANYLSVNRRSDPLLDVYSIDLGSRLNEALRRRLRRTLDALSLEDRRIESYAFSCCTNDDFPLVVLTAAKTFSTWWENTRRSILLEQKDLVGFGNSHLANLISLLESPQAHHDLHVVLGSVFHLREQEDHWKGLVSSYQAILQDTRDRAIQEEEAVLVMSCSLSPVSDEGGGPSRWATALLAWLPRPLSGDDLTKLREHTAAHLLQNDPSLKDNRRGLAILERLREDQPIREQEVRKILKTAYAEGTVLDAAGDTRSLFWREVKSLAEDKNRIQHSSQKDQNPGQLSVASLDELLTRIADKVLPQVFPRFHALAPAERVTSMAGSNLVSDCLIQRSEANYFAKAGLERALQSLVIPLGLGAFQKGQFRYLRREDITSTETVLAGYEAIQSALSTIISFVPVEDFLLQPSDHSFVPLSRLVAFLSKSEIGLIPELAQVAIAWLLREGELIALDGDLVPLSIQELRVPLEQGVYGLCRGRLMSEEEWKETIILAEKLDLPTHVSYSLSSQEALWQSICQFRKEWQPQVESCFTRLAQLQQGLNQERLQWSEVHRALETWSQLLQAIHPQALAEQGLADLRERLDSSALLPLPSLQVLSSFLHTKSEFLVVMNRYLSADKLAPPNEKLADAREKLLALLQSGEGLINDIDSLGKQWESFQTEYARCYLKWHQKLYSTDLFQPYLHLKQSILQQVLGRFSQITVHAFPTITDLEGRINRELSKHCDPVGLEQSLHRSPVCPRCGLRLGESLSLTPVTELKAQQLTVLSQCLGLFSEALVREKLLAHLEGMGAEPVALKLRELMEVTSQVLPERLLWLLDEEVLTHVELAFSPQKISKRKLSDLTHLLAGKTLPRQTALELIHQWLDKSGHLEYEHWVRFEGE